MSFLRNAWYPLCWSDEVAGVALKPCMILGERVVLYRKGDGGIAALEDICPHKFLPLSMGRRKGDQIECGYHGMTFDCSGRCTVIPGQPVVPATARVRAYPVADRLGLVWIWMGDPAKADEGSLTDLPQYHDPAWKAVHGASLFNAANYLNLIDNLLDPSHVTFVHGSTLATPGGRDVPVQCERQGDGITVWRWILDSPPIPVFAKTGHFKGNADRWHYYMFTPPSNCVIDFGSGEPGALTEETRSQGLQIFACHFITPVDETSCIDHWLHVRNFRIDDTALDAQLNADLAGAFNEDKAILEAIQQQEARYPERRQMKLAIDGGPNRMRMVMRRLMEAETRQDAASDTSTAA
ncbi:MAG: aromatic ring-hydroxylating dioxygenase subunit alpha [Sneathiellaceae bacterium]